LNKKIIFLIKFFTIYTILQTIILTANITPLQNTIATIAGNSTNLATENNTIHFKTNKFNVTPNCTGLLSASILTAIIFSLKKPPLKQKIIIATTGTLILLTANMIRVIIVVLAGIHYNTAHTTHTITWFLMTAIIIGTWYHFTKKITKTKNFKNFL
jgi:exosortase/archaeosortase family protein